LEIARVSFLKKQNESPHSRQVRLLGPWAVVPEAEFLSVAIKQLA
jgi:hypothetical protein